MQLSTSVLVQVPILNDKQLNTKKCGSETQMILGSTYSVLERFKTEYRCWGIRLGNIAFAICRLTSDALGFFHADILIPRGS